MKNLDFKRAFDFVRSGENWYKTILIGGSLYWLMDILNFIVNHNYMPFIPRNLVNSLLQILKLLIYFALTGYSLCVSHNQISNKLDVLPSWSDFIKFIKHGFLVFIPYLVYFLPIVLYFEFIYRFASALIKQLSTQLALLFMTINLLFSIFVIFPVVIVIATMLALTYSENLRMSNCFKPLRMFKLFKNALPVIPAFILMFLLLGISGYIFLILEQKNIIIFTVFNSLLGFMSFPIGVFIAHLSAQAYKYALSKEKDLALAPAEPQID